MVCQEPAKADARRKVSQTPPETVSQQSSGQWSERQNKVEGSSFTAQTTLTLETAMSLYGLTDSQSFWETEQDTRCLLGWGSNTVVVAFRGTASMKNALADVQVPSPCTSLPAPPLPSPRKLWNLSSYNLCTEPVSVALVRDNL